MKQLGIWGVLGIWAGLCLGGALYASWQGYGGRAFGATLTVFAFFLLVMLVFAARGVAEGLADEIRAGRRILPGHVRVCVVRGVSAGNRGVCGGARRGYGSVDLCAAGLGCVRGTSGGRGVAGLCNDCGHLGVREIRAIPLAVAIPKCAIGVRYDGVGGSECGAGGVCAGAAAERDWLFDRMGKRLGIVRGGELRVVRMHRGPAGDGDALHHVCAAVGAVERVFVQRGGDIGIHGVAGGVFVSRAAAKFAGAGFQDGLGGMVDGVAGVRFFTHHEPGLSELAVRGAGNDCWDFLWLDVAKERVDFRVGAGARSGGCDVALPVPDGVANCAERKFETGSGRGGVG